MALAESETVSHFAAVVVPALISGAVAVTGIIITWILKRSDTERQNLLESEVRILQRAQQASDRERAVRFEALHTQRVRIIAEMYRLLSVSCSNLEWAMDMQPGDDETAARVREWSKTANEFFEYYDQNRIWLPPKTCTILDKTWDKLKRAGYMTQDSTVKWDTNRSTARTFVTNEFKPARDELDAEFRELLGTIDPRRST